MFPTAQFDLHVVLISQHCISSDHSPEQVQKQINRTIKSALYCGKSIIITNGMNSRSFELGN